jgi:hypothetical protein
MCCIFNITILRNVHEPYVLYLTYYNTPKRPQAMCCIFHITILRNSHKTYVLYLPYYNTPKRPQATCAVSSILQYFETSTSHMFCIFNITILRNVHKPHVLYLPYYNTPKRPQAICAVSSILKLPSLHFIFIYRSYLIFISVPSFFLSSQPPFSSLTLLPYAHLR